MKGKMTMKEMSEEQVDWMDELEFGEPEVKCAGCGEFEWAEFMSAMDSNLCAKCITK